VAATTRGVATMVAPEAVRPAGRPGPEVRAVPRRRGAVSFTQVLSAFRTPA